MTTGPVLKFLLRCVAKSPRKGYSFPCCRSGAKLTTPNARAHQATFGPVGCGSALKITCTALADQRRCFHAVYAVRYSASAARVYTRCPSLTVRHGQPVRVFHTGRGDAVIRGQALRSELVVQRDRGLAARNQTASQASRERRHPVFAHPEMLCGQQLIACTADHRCRAPPNSESGSSLRKRVIALSSR